MDLARLKQIIDDIRTVRPWPPIARRVLQLSTSPEVSSEDLVQLIQLDAALTAGVLRLCNSAAYGFQREVASLPEAATRLGSEAVVQLVLASCVEESVDESPLTPARRRELWETSLRTALTAHFLAVRQGKVLPEVAYTAGLLCQFGYLVLEPHLEPCRAELGELLDGGADRASAERELLGIEHATVAGRMMRRWEFPEHLVDAVEHHHSPRRAAVEPQLAALLHLAERLAEVVGSGGDVRSLAACSEALELTGLDPESLQGYEVALQLEMARATELAAAP